eukprot:4804336-Amphidinium_carterae.1
MFHSFLSYFVSYCLGFFLGVRGLPIPEYSCPEQMGNLLWTFFVNKSDPCKIKEAQTQPKLVNNHAKTLLLSVLVSL